MSFWMFKPRELRSTFKMRILGFCDVRGCFNKRTCSHTRYCTSHNPISYWGIHYPCHEITEV